RILAKVRPDLVVIDAYIGSPALIKSDLPFIVIYSAAPLMLFNCDNLPPPWSGLPSLSTKSNTILQPESKYLNIYMYPKELDYNEWQPLPHNWKRVDGFVRTTGHTFAVPDRLTQRPGKLILLSMGSIGCALLELMIRLTSILAKSEHKFIVTKGPLHDEYELPDNMYGQPFLPQTAVLPLVDLVITHGGNNTVTEAFYYGKPLLAIAHMFEQTGMTMETMDRVKVEVCKRCDSCCRAIDLIEKTVDDDKETTN
ncbi:unnamed protein product, partial [Oppiella nova]